ncbi:MAG: hypothetical protein JNM43_16090 [Planctomycetaceae bacterium]|nr:hypothetical protein [Planctomycetaceae bacterium]
MSAPKNLPTLLVYKDPSCFRIDEFGSLTGGRKQEIRSIIQDLNYSIDHDEEAFLPGQGVVELKSASLDTIREFLTYSIASICGLVLDVRIVEPKTVSSKSTLGECAVPKALK